MTTYLQLGQLPAGGAFTPATDRQVIVRNGVTALLATPVTYQLPITLTTTGSSGAATLIGQTLNIPQYSGGGGSGITRSVNSVSTTTTGGATALTDYVYLCTGTFTFTLPTAVGNTNRYTVKNVGTGVITIAGTSAQTMDGASTVVLSTQYQSNDFISNNANWDLI